MYKCQILWGVEYWRGMYRVYCFIWLAPEERRKQKLCRLREIELKLHSSNKLLILWAKTKLYFSPMWYICPHVLRTNESSIYLSNKWNSAWIARNAKCSRSLHSSIKSKQTLQMYESTILYKCTSVAAFKKLARPGVWMIHYTLGSFDVMLFQLSK